MSTIVKPQPHLFSFAAPTDSLLATVFRLGWLPHFVRRHVEQEWFSTTFHDRWYSEIDTAPRQLEELLKWIDLLHQDVSTLVRRSPCIAAESGCLLALSTFRTHLKKLWRAPRSLDGRLESFHRDKLIVLGPVNLVFASQEWQDFSPVSLARLAEWLAEPYASFFELGRHIGPIIFPSTKKVYDEFAGKDYRFASAEVARKARSLLMKARRSLRATAGPCPVDLRSKCTHILGQLKAATTEELRYDALAKLLHGLFSSLCTLPLQKPPLEPPLNEVTGPFGLSVLVKSTDPYVAVVIRVDYGSIWPRIRLKGECARIAAELIKSCGEVSKQILWGRNGTSTEAMYQQITMTRKQCFHPMGIDIKADRDLGYRLVERPRPLTIAPKGTSRKRSTANQRKVAPR